jgi:hypothetical protein
VVGFGSAACSLLVSGEDSPLKCAEEGAWGPPACDVGFACSEGQCVRQRQSPAGAAGAMPLAGAGAESAGGAVGGGAGAPIGAGAVGTD